MRSRTRSRSSTCPRFRLRNALALLLLLLGLLVGCASTGPSSATNAPAPRLGQAPGPSLQEQVEAMRKAQAAAESAPKPQTDSAAYKKSWDEFLSAIDALLNHPEGWSLDPQSLPLRLAVDRPDYRVLAQDEGYKPADAIFPLQTLWVQWRDGAGVTHAQVLYRGDSLHVARANDSTLLLLSHQLDAELEAWQLHGSAWQRTVEPFAAIGEKIGDLAVARKEEKLVFAHGWWNYFTADGSKQAPSTQGVPYLCHEVIAASSSCYKLQADDGRISFAAPDAGQIARPGALETIRANLSIGYQSPRPGDAFEAQTKAREGLVTYLKTPVSQQLSPADFAAFFKDTSPGSVRLIELAPHMRVYTMITRPDYQPEAKAWLQWWSDPAIPLVKPLQLGIFAGLHDAVLVGAESDPVLVYTEATFPTRHSTGRGVTALRYDSAKHDWVADTRAFPASLPKAVGEVALVRNEDGSGLEMYRPKDPALSNDVFLDAQGITICDTKVKCLKLSYKEHQFIPQS